MKRVHITILFVIFSMGLTWSQAFYKPMHDYWEGWVGVGGATYYGDIGSKATIIQPSFEVGGRYFLSNHLAVSAGATYASLKGDDSFNNTTRAYSFIAYLGEFSGNAEVFLFSEGSKFKRYGSYKGAGSNEFNFFVIAGAGYMLFGNQAYNDGEYERLTTESYDKSSYVIRFGGGLKYTFDNIWAVSLSVIDRVTATDYIDDFSSGTNKNDVYIITMFNIIYKLDSRNK